MIIFISCFSRNSAGLAGPEDPANDESREITDHVDVTDGRFYLPSDDSDFIEEEEEVEDVGDFESEG